MSQKAAIRRRKQASKNYMHMAPMDRPHYGKSPAHISAERLRRTIEKQKAMQQRKGSCGKK